jgi:hypothetical protein
MEIFFPTIEMEKFGAYFFMPIPLHRLKNDEAPSAFIIAALAIAEVESRMSFSELGYVLDGLIGLIIMLLQVMVQ